MPRHPNNVDFDLIWGNTLEIDSCNQCAQKLFLMRVGELVRAPQRGQSLGDIAKLFTLLWRMHLLQRGVHKALVIFLCCAKLIELFLPTLLQGERHQTMGRIDSIVLALRQIGFILGALELLLPMFAA